MGLLCKGLENENGKFPSLDVLSPYVPLPSTTRKRLADDGHACL